MRETKFLIRLFAGLALLAAGIIHTFPAVWQKWDSFMLQMPSAHFRIGAVGLTLGVANLILLTVEALKPKHD